MPAGWADCPLTCAACSKIQVGDYLRAIDGKEVAGMHKTAVDQVWLIFVRKWLLAQGMESGARGAGFDREERRETQSDTVSDACDGHGRT